MKLVLLVLMVTLVAPICKGTAYCMVFIETLLPKTPINVKTSSSFLKCLAALFKADITINSQEEGHVGQRRTSLSEVTDSKKRESSCENEMCLGKDPCVPLPELLMDQNGLNYRNGH